MSKFLDTKYGEGTADMMVNESNKTVKFDRSDYKQTLLDNARTLLDESTSKKLWDWKSGMLKWEMEFLTNLDNYSVDSEIILNNYRIG